MPRFVVLFGLFLGCLLFSQQADASADTTCYPEWSLYSHDRGCASTAVISPGNDTRANLLLLLQDTARRGRNVAYPDLGWDITFQRNYFDWSLMRQAFYHQPGQEDSVEDSFGGRCISYYSGTKAYRAALEGNREISDADRKTLSEKRELIIDACKWDAYLESSSDGTKNIFSRIEEALGGLQLGSKAAQEYRDYLIGAAGFYYGDFAAAAAHFGKLQNSKDDWIKETASYMAARVQLNAAQEKSFDEWGSFAGQESIDAPAAGKAEAEFLAYLKSHPSGRYAASARGLMRRVYWLQNKIEPLAAEYQRLLDSAGATDPADLAEEIDSKLLFQKGAMDQIQQPMLLAVIDLLRMRDDEYAYEQWKTITRAELEAQKDRFVGNESLYELLLANYAFYVEGDAKRVLQLIPDAARQENFSYLEFSRQALRGKALQKLGDRNEGGFWRDVIGGSQALYQRPIAELGLAIHYEQAGQLAKVFEANSPITEKGIRKILIERVAGPEILRGVVNNKSRPQDERDLALFTLLYNSLSRGDFASFVKDQTSITQNSNSDAGLWRLAASEEIPVGMFGAGQKKGEYTCPSLRQTAQTLASSPKNASARLCLGDFWLENGFDYFNQSYDPYGRTDDNKPGLPKLGDSKTQFPGSAIPRHQFYTEIIVDPRAKADEKAYALYRLVRCYATSGNNSCGGISVEKAQRKAWFQQLKRNYPNSKWAQKLKYFW
jgi:hypothetical protein